MSDTWCRLDNGYISGYKAAYPLSSKLKVPNQLTYIGTGLIGSVNGKAYSGTTRLKFYKATKKVNNYGYKKK